MIADLMWIVTIASVIGTVCGWHMTSGLITTPRLPYLRFMLGWQHGESTHGGGNEQRNRKSH